MIERTFPGVHPHPTITAPLHMPLDHHDEALRLATFVQSDAMRNNRVVTPSRNPARNCTPQHAALPSGGGLGSNYDHGGPRSPVNFADRRGA